MIQDTIKHYINNYNTMKAYFTRKVAVFDKDENDVTHDYYDIDYIKNKKEVLDYFLN